MAKYYKAEDVRSMFIECIDILEENLDMDIVNREECGGIYEYVDGVLSQLKSYDYDISEGNGKCE